jgi:hypothetical protein
MSGIGCTLIAISCCCKRKAFQIGRFALGSHEQRTMAVLNAKAIAALLQRCAIEETETALDAMTRLFALYGEASLDQRAALREKIESLLSSCNATVASAACTSFARIAISGSIDISQALHTLVAALEQHSRADYSDKENVTHAIVRSIIGIYLQQLQTAGPSTNTAAPFELMLEVDPLIGSCLLSETANSITAAQATHLIGNVLSLVLLRPQQQYLRSSALTKVNIMLLLI